MAKIHAVLVGGHIQGLSTTASQVPLQLVADRSITHDLACKTFFSTEKSMQNMRTGLQNNRPACDYKYCFGCVGTPNVG